MATFWIILIFIAGVVLAFPAAVLICAFLGWLLLLIGTKCPRCGKRKLECHWSVLSDPVPSPAYYKCENCGVRLKRLFSGPWEDASGPEYDEFYKPGVFGSMKGHTPPKP